MKWIVVKLSGDATRPRLRNRRRHDHDREARPSARQRPIVIKDDETGTVIVLSRPVQGTCQRVARPHERIGAKSPSSPFVSFELSYAG
jgi:hypothetical protein